MSSPAVCASFSQHKPLVALWKTGAVLPVEGKGTCTPFRKHFCWKLESCRITGGQQGNCPVSKVKRLLEKGGETCFEGGETCFEGGEPVLRVGKPVLRVGKPVLIVGMPIL